jgi:type IV secretory pathway protease TraF
MYRRGVLAAGLFGIVVLGCARPATRLVWNASASAPIGFYWLRAGGARRSGAGEPARRAPPSLAAERDYLRTPPPEAALRGFRLMAKLRS